MSGAADVAGGIVAEAVRDKIIDPIAFLAGMFANIKDTDVDPELVANLFGLVVRGARAELQIHREGGYCVKYLNELLGQPMTAQV